MTRLTAEQKVKWLILAADSRLTGEDPIDYDASTGYQIDEAYEKLEESDELWDAKAEVRGGEFETKLQCEWSRHLESKAVAARLPDGSWVGWTYWYGGGKHAEPEAVDWIPDAYDVGCVEEEKMVLVRTFTMSVEVAA